MFLHWSKFMVQEQRCLPQNHSLFSPLPFSHYYLGFYLVGGTARALWHLHAPKGSFFQNTWGFNCLYGSQRAFSLPALVLLITFLVIIPNYDTGTIQAMQFLSVEQSHHELSPKACKTETISWLKRILQWSPSNFTHRLQSDQSFRFKASQS